MSKTNTPQEREFFDAVADGYVERVRQLVRGNPELLDAFDYNSFGATPITRVGFHDDRQMLQTLIELGADVNRRSDWQMGPWSPLHSAIFSRNCELAEFLLSNGATLDAHTAAGLGQVDELARLLDDLPARVSEPGGDGCQPLHFADTTTAAQLLLERGADIEARCLDHYSTPVQYLAGARPEVARFLFAQGAKADIFSAILADDRPLVKTLIDRDPGILDARIDQKFFPPGPDHNVHNILTFTIGHGSSPLHAAAKANLPSMAELLVAAGQSPDVRGGYDNATSLHIAAWEDNVAVARSLVDLGADLEARSGRLHNNSPAGWAIVAGSADVFDLLLDLGAAVLDFFVDDVEAALAGEFRRHRVVPEENYHRIANRLKALSQ